MGDSRLNPAYTTFINGLKTQGVISERVFSFYLSNNSFAANDFDSTSECRIGEVDTTHASGGLTYLPLYTSQGSWSLQLTALHCGSSITPTVNIATFDTGSALLLAPAADAFNIITGLNTVGACAIDAFIGLIMCDCETHAKADYPDMVFSLGGSDFALSADDYFWQVGNM